jgi:hypothetical protein
MDKNALKAVPLLSEAEQKYRDRFSGRDDVFGVFKPDRSQLGQKRGPGEKLAGRLWVEKRPPTDLDWRGHFDGTGPIIGIFPIHLDGTVTWGSVDIDEYPIDRAKLAAQISHLPLVPMMSKSGGCHLFIFVDELVPAADMKARLHWLAAQIGRPDAEVFPKQTSLKGKKVGSYLTMSYWFYARYANYSFDDKGNSLMIEEAVEVMETKVLTREQFYAIPAVEVTEREAPDEADDPDIDLLAEDGDFGESQVQLENDRLRLWLFRSAVFLRETFLALHQRPTTPLRLGEYAFRVTRAG